jgi:hypothetical protein
VFDLFEVFFTVFGELVVPPLLRLLGWLVILPFRGIRGLVRWLWKLPARLASPIPRAIARFRSPVQPDSNVHALTTAARVDSSSNRPIITG